MSSAPPLQLLILPYSSADGRSLLQVLIDEFRSEEWACFQSAVAFVSASGNFPDLLRAMLDFAHRGNEIQMTFGADSFSRESRGSDYQALEAILQTLVDEPLVEVYLYHERGRTFHPKIYLFSNEEDNRALLIVGSSNWSTGGLVQNIEASLLARLDLTNEAHRKCFDDAQRCFSQFWRET